MATKTKKAFDVDSFIKDTLGSFLCSTSDISQSDTIAEIAIKYTKQLNPTMRGDNYGFLGYEYLIQPFLDMWPKIVVTKRAQIGATDALARRDAIFCMQYPGIKTIYTFPTADDMRLYVKDRFDDLIRESPLLQTALRGNPDSVEMKKFGSSSIIFRGRSSERQAISIPAQRLTHDEADFSEQEIMESFRSRLGNASLMLTKEQYDAVKKYEQYINIRAKEVAPDCPDFPILHAVEYGRGYIIEGGMEIRFSTPTIPGYGVSRLYYGDTDNSGSDQMQLFIRHPDCGMWQQPKWGHESIEGFWDIGEKDPESDAFIKCLGCGKPIDFKKLGQWQKAFPLQYEHLAWVPKYKTSQWRGYYLPWYTAAFHRSIRQLIYDYHGYKDKAKRDNFFLGIPSIEANNALTMDIMNKCHKPDYEWESCSDGLSEYVMGADQGVYRVIAKRIPYTDTEVNPLGKIAIVKIAHTPNNAAFPHIESGTLKDNGEISRDMQLFEISTLAIDNLPNETSAKQVADLHLGHVWRVTSSGTLKADITHDEEAMTATESRLKALDKTIKYVMDGNLILPLLETPECKDFKRHCCNMIKVSKERTDSLGRPTGDVESIYNKIGPEHYLHALKFLIEAMELSYLSPVCLRIADPFITELHLKT